MSLHDILMDRAAIHFGNEMGGFNANVGLNDLYSSIGANIKAEQEKVQKQRDAERLDAKRQEQFNNIINMQKRSDSAGTRIKTAIDKDGNVSATIIPVDEDELAYKQESLQIRRDNLEQKKAEESRRLTTQKLNNARNFGGVIKAPEMAILNEEAGFDLGTDVNSGRIEQTPTGDFRVLSNDEFKKKSDVIKAQLDQEAELSNVEKDVNQIYGMFDEITPNLKGPIEGRTKGPVQGFLGNTNVSTYNDLKGTFLGPLARRIAMEKGVLTQQDIDRIVGLLPKLSDTEDIKNKKRTELQVILENRKKVIKNRAAMSAGSIRNGSSTMGQDFDNFDTKEIPELDRTKKLYDKYGLTR